MSRVSENISLGLMCLWVALTTMTLIGRVDAPWWNAALFAGLLAFYNLKDYYAQRRDRELKEELFPNRNSRSNP